MGGAKERPVSCAEFKQVLQLLGFAEKPKKNRGSHEKWVHPSFKGYRRVVTVDCPKAPFHRKLLKNMLNQAGLTKREFFACLASEVEAKKLAQKHSGEPVEQPADTPAKERGF